MSEVKLSKPQLLLHLPREVNNIFAIFGDKIRLVGGAVRDLLLEKEVKDFDFATSLNPDQVKDRLHENNINYVDLAEKFGTIIAVLNNKNFEITTLRKEHSYDGRHCQVSFSTSFFEDAKRRDFTINALYLDSIGIVYDYFNGIDHLKKLNIEFIGDAKNRITEDYLRILRFFRFNCRFGNNFNQDNLQSCIDLKDKLSQLSKSRIRDEFLKIINSSSQLELIKTLEVMQQYGFFDILFANSLNITNLNGLLSLLQQLEIKSSSNLRIAALFANKELMLQSLKVDLELTKKEVKYLHFFLNHLNYNIDDQQEFIDLLADDKNEFIQDFYLFKQIYGQKALDLANIKENLAFLDQYMVAIFPLNGNDIIKLGFKEQEVGKILKKCKIKWLNSNFKFSKDAMLEELNSQIVVNL